MIDAEKTFNVEVIPDMKLNPKDPKSARKVLEDAVRQIPDSEFLQVRSFRITVLA